MVRLPEAVLCRRSSGAQGTEMHNKPPESDSVLPYKQAKQEMTWTPRQRQQQTA